MLHAHAFSPPGQAGPGPGSAGLCGNQARKPLRCLPRHATAPAAATSWIRSELASGRQAGPQLSVCCSAFATGNDSAVFRHPGELNLNLREYMVVLEKPVGLTLAPDPLTGQVVVQDIKTNSPAHKCGLVQVGDVVKSVSAVFGDDMWPASDLRRVRWAMTGRLGDVRLILERGARRGGGGAGAAAWYCRGKSGVVTGERDGMQLPYSFHGPASDDPAALALELPGPGKALQVAFHRSAPPPSPPSRRAAAAAAARAAALQRLRRELLSARGLPRLDLGMTSVPPRSGSPENFVLPSAAAAIASSGGGRSTTPSGGGSKQQSASSGSAATAGGGGPKAGGGGGGGGGSDGAPPPPVVDVIAPAPSISGGGGGGLLSGLKLGGGSGSGTAAPATAAAAAAGSSAPAKDKRVISFLPWLLVSSGRLEHRHIANIASSRSLGSLLELTLTRTQLGNPAAAATTAAAPSSPTSSAPAAAPAPAAAAAGPAAAAAADGPDGKPSGSGTAAGSAALGGSGTAAAGYLVVRGADLVPFLADIGRVSFQALEAAATAAGGTPAGPAPAPAPSSGTSASSSSDSPSLPSPSAAAANGQPSTVTGVVEALTAAPTTGGGAVGTPDTNGTGAPTLPAAGPTANGNTVSNASSASVTNANGSTKGNGGLGGNAMAALLGRSIFLNLRPGAAPAAAGKPQGPPNSPSSAASSPAAAPPPGATAAAASRFDPLRIRHLLHATACLQRLAFRRQGALSRARRGSCAVLLHCQEEGMAGEVAVLLAGWLHWYGRLPLQEASLAAETAMGAPVDQGLLEAATDALLTGARERCSSVVLTWKYGGLSAYVAGDVVASWGARVPMVRCRSPLGCKGDTHPGHFYLEVQGLRPGVYYYKYIIDGTWAIDSLSSKVLDSAGNWNNVLLVPEPPQVLTSREGLALARWQAGRLALEARMGLSGPGARPL
ncbi:hypothetical protein HYH03_017515 [Edaphochlamys debaryana]|uniref:AMP-activated protein kinase glycogen-binding domain-containing protein n=1 Tax=Edaphochlamys debaryana TaxID=47281 RepID=A0A835XIA9_9CHLO|nr:hypothetical protein HYH03_017515 [Edaphochlamys debaryana]|eukprot:KAG2483637.1 hypothetical protein HYH03_017515 [Edaphochlamys debaryana]